MKAIDLMITMGIPSRAEARRLLIQGGLKINDKFVIVKEHEDQNMKEVEVQSGDKVQIGKRISILYIPRSGE